MARLVELGPDFPESLSLRPGDMLNISASGGRVESGADAIEPIGPFVPAVLGLDGRLISPQTPPTNMLFRALCPGRARLLVFSGGGLVPTRSDAIDILVEPDDAQAD